MARGEAPSICRTQPRAAWSACESQRRVRTERGVVSVSARHRDHRRELQRATESRGGAAWPGARRHARRSAVADEQGGSESETSRATESAPAASARRAAKRQPPPTSGVPTWERRPASSVSKQREQGSSGDEETILYDFETDAQGWGRQRRRHGREYRRRTGGDGQHGAEGRGAGAGGRDEQLRGDARCRRLDHTDVHDSPNFPGSCRRWASRLAPPGGTFSIDSITARGGVLECAGEGVNHVQRLDAGQQRYSAVSSLLTIRQLQRLER